LNNSPTALIVEDDIVLLNILEQKLRLENLNVFIAGDYKQAIDILTNKNIDIVLLDVFLPGLDGFTLIDHIKKSWSEIYVIFMSSKGEPKYKIKAFAKGADDYIVKPFDLDELLARIGVGKKQILAKEIFRLQDNQTKLNNKTALEEGITFVNKCNNLDPSTLVLISLKNIENSYKKTPQIFFEKIILPFSQLLKKVYDQDAFRIGEFEFVLFFRNIDLEDTKHKLLKLFNNIETELNFRNNSFSFSVAQLPKDNPVLTNILTELYGNLIKYKKDNPFDVEEKSNKPRILIIDDDDVIIRLIMTRLQSRNFEIFQASDGEKGLQAIYDFHPDIVLLDLMLPIMDGFEVTEQIRSNPSFENIKIIMLSAKKQEEIINKALKSGVDDFIVKPFSLLEIEVRLNKILKELYD
jgi:DNA-binding response OmpR family regulator